MSDEPKRCEECCGEGWVYPDDDALELVDDDGVTV